MAILALSATMHGTLRAQTPVAGSWSGRATAGVEETAVSLHLELGGGAASAAIDLPDLGVRGWPARSAELRSDSVIVRIASDAGEGVMALALRGDRLVGIWREPGRDEPATLSLTRVRPAEVIETAPGTELSFESADGTTLAGTLLLPEGPGPFPAVVFVHGSGPQPREASRFVAEEYVRRGIAALIYDKRGVGGSEGDWRTVGLESLAEDAAAAMNAVARHARVEPAKVGLQGQSQGGWIGPLAATYRPETAFMVLVSGPWTTPAIEGHWSHLWEARRAGVDDEGLERIVRHLELRDEAVRSGAWPAYLRDVEEARDHGWFRLAGLDPEPDPDAWYWGAYRMMLDFDPVPLFEELAVPVLGVFGALDESIPALESADRLRDVASRLSKPYEAVVYPTADHALRIAEVDGRRARWPGYPPGYLSTLSDWILAQTGRR